MTNMSFKHIKLWILSDGKKGHENQSIGVAEALGIEDYQIIPIQKRRFGSLLKYIFPTWSVKNLPKEDFPDMVIAAGQITAVVSQYIRMCSPHTFVVQMMKPRKPYDLYDVIAAPHYDALPQLSNVIQTVGAPNRITKAKLEEAYVHWQMIFSHLKEKRLAVLIGGDSSRYTFDEKEAKTLADEVNLLAEREGYSLMVTASRRTGLEEYELLKKEFTSEQNYFWDDEGENPYFGLLAHADAIVVTAESISMISEACTTGKPVYVFGAGANLSGKKWGKFNQFFTTLKKQHRIKALGTGYLQPPEEALADTVHVASFVRAKYMQTRG